MQVRLGWAGLGWGGLGWAGLGWAGLGWAGLGWAGLLLLDSWTQLNSEGALLQYQCWSHVTA